MDIGFYQVTQRLYELFKAQGFNTITLDEEQELDLKRQSIYPLVHIVPVQSGFTTSNTDTLSFLLIVLDLTDLNKDNPREGNLMYYGIDNRQDILHALREKLRNVVTDFVRGDSYSENMQASLPIGIDPIIVDFENILTGWSCLLSITIPSSSTIC